jgi:hypothetical protein
MATENPHLRPAKRLAAALRQDGIELSPTQVEMACLIFSYDEMVRVQEALTSSGVLYVPKPCPKTGRMIEHLIAHGTEGSQDGIAERSEG